MFKLSKQIVASENRRFMCWHVVFCNSVLKCLINSLVISHNCNVLI